MDLFDFCWCGGWHARSHVWICEREGRGAMEGGSQEAPGGEWHVEGLCGDGSDKEACSGVVMQFFCMMRDVRCEARRRV